MLYLNAISCGDKKVKVRCIVIDVDRLAGQSQGGSRKMNERKRMMDREIEEK